MKSQTKGKKVKEPQLHRVVRRAEEGDFGDTLTIRISAYGYSMTRLGDNPKKLKTILKQLLGEEKNIVKLLLELKKL